jgi:hypothetical protein
MMPVLIALAGFVVFLCVFGLRGLMIAGAVVGVVLGWFVWVEHVDAVRHQREDAAFHAAALRRQSEADSAPPVMAEPPCEEQYASVSDVIEQVSLRTWCHVLAGKQPPASKQDIAYAAMLWRLQGEAWCNSNNKTADEKSGCMASHANGD